MVNYFYKCNLCGWFRGSITHWKGGNKCPWGFAFGSYDIVGLSSLLIILTSVQHTTANEAVQPLKM